MTMNSSGPISLGGTVVGESIGIQNGGNGTTEISLNDLAVRTLAGVPNGQIVMPDDFWGKGGPLPPLYLYDVNLRDYALANGWDGTSAYTATFASNVYVCSTSTSNAALTIDGAWPNGVTVINSGYIVGHGGEGGIGPNGATAGSAGGNGGTALSVSTSVTIQNAGTIGGGGGGGGGGQCSASGTGYYACGGGGGGGAGFGAGGYARPDTFGGGGSGGNGQPGTATSGGAGGLGSYGGTNTNYGGAGGNLGAAGAAGSGTGTPPYTWVFGPYGGGSPGNAVTGNSNITWTATGTRLGPIV